MLALSFSTLLVKLPLQRCPALNHDLTIVENKVNPYVVSKPAVDNQGYELFGEIALKNQRFNFLMPFRCRLHELIQPITQLHTIDRLYGRVAVITR